MIHLVIKPDPFAKVDPRRRKELRDARMIYEDHRAIANCPPEPIYHEFPKEDDNPRYPQ
jgi:hypothetical protein